MPLRDDGHVDPRLTRSLGRVLLGLAVAMALVGAERATGEVDEPARPDLVVAGGTINAPATVSGGVALRQFTPCVTLVNAERAQAGRPPVALDVRLSIAAHAHSVDQAARLTMTHAGADGSDAGDRMADAGFGWQAWGENVARGQRDCTAVMSAWMNSAGHRANILNGGYTHIGMGAVLGTNGQIYWTMDLATAG